MTKNRACFVATIFLALIVLQVASLGAQQRSPANNPRRHARYKFVDLGTLGSPDSILEFFEPGVIINAGTVVG